MSVDSIDVFDCRLPDVIMIHEKTWLRNMKTNFSILTNDYADENICN